ncbi:MAG: hypothetical protein [Olavius algarvensis Gamma 1 endosymbiont]|nr:MAG: hypothetical protein [Olavius algarvensis Gamma 1 endosymbiont]
MKKRNIGIRRVYSAFRKAGVPENDARQAAEALSAENLATKADIVKIKRELSVVKWMLGIVIAAQVVPLLRAIGAI